MSINESTRTYHWRIIGHLMSVTALTMLLVPLVYGQCVSNQEAATKRAQDIPHEYLRKAPGKLVTKGRNTIAVGPLRVKTYRLEEVLLPEPIEFELQGRKVLVEGELRLSVVLDRPLPGNYVIWIGDDRYQATRSKDDEVSVQLPSSMRFEDEETIAVSKGTGCASSSLSTLPERLEVPPRLRRSPEENVEGIEMKIRRVPEPYKHPESSYVAIEIIKRGGFDNTRNAMLVAQVGRQEFAAGVTPNHSAVFGMTAEQFARARDGDRIKIKYGFCTPGGMYVGRLDKSLLDR